MVRVDECQRQSCLSSAFRGLRAMHAAGKRKSFLLSNHGGQLPVAELDLPSRAPIDTWA